MDLSTPIKPKVGLWLRMRKYSKVSKFLKTKDRGKDKGKQVERNEDEGKLAALMNITLDVFFEIVMYLQPIDLLQLCRVSKKFRATFMSKSARHLWIAARNNDDILPVPDPLPGMSEPRLAAMLFERTCFACGADEAEATYFALGLRFCDECEKINVKACHTLVRWKNKDLPECFWNMIPIDFDWIAGIPALTDANSEKSFRMRRRCYAPEFKRVVAQYRMLDGQKAIDDFIQRRLEYVASSSKGAQAIMKWYISRREIIESDRGMFSCCCHRPTSIAILSL